MLGPVRATGKQISEWVTERAKGKDCGGGWRCWPASGHRQASSCSWRALSIRPTHSFWVFLLSSLATPVCRPTLLHLATKCGNSSRLVFSPPFFSYVLSLSGFNHALSFRCHLYANTFRSICTLDASEPSPLNPTMDFIFPLGCLKVPTCPDGTQDLLPSPELVFLQDFLPTTPPIAQGQESVNHPWVCSLHHPLEPTHYQVLLVLPVEYVVTLTASLPSASLSPVTASGSSHLDLQ